MGTIKATDSAGNDSFPAPVPTFTIDTVASVLSTTSIIGNTNNINPDISFTTTDAGTITVDSSGNIPHGCFNNISFSRM